MAFFAVEYSYVEDTAALDATRTEHRSYLSRLAIDGAVIASGPYLGVGAPGRALLIFRAPDRQALDGLVADDPFQTAGLVTQTRVTEWNPVIGVLADS
ncbi:MAG TPA: YciI family protein [Dermatophilaceae bacterium]|nr:YciI family protein [Dermatophilaceae bacterium]